MNVITFIKGLMLLRYPETVRVIGQLRLEEIKQAKIRSNYPGVVIHKDVFINGLEQGKLKIDTGVRVEKGSILSLGDNFIGYGSLEVGENTWIGQYNNIRTGNASISIGKNCLISQFCSLIGANHKITRGKIIRQSPLDTRKVNIKIGDDVWLGAGSTIMPGVILENGCVVGANSVITKSIPGDEIWAGVPARKIGQRD